MPDIGHRDERRGAIQGELEVRRMFDPVEKLKEYVRHGSVSADPAFRAGMAGAQQFLTTLLTGMGFKVELVPTALHPVLLAKRGDNPAWPHVIIYGHYDVQPPDPLELWQSPPFEPEIRGERIYGRGTADNKGPLLVHITAVARLLEKNPALPLRITFVVEGEEEIGSPFFGPLTERHRDLLAADLVLAHAARARKVGDLLRHQRRAHVAGADGIHPDEVALAADLDADGPQHLLVPTEKAELLSANLALMKPQELVDWQSYTVRSGDSLHGIANRHHLSVSMLKDVNRLSGNNLRIGQVLTIPGKPGVQPSEPLYQQRSVAQAPAARTYQVKNGDNLWQIARANQVAVHDLQRWNKLQGNQLKVGQVLNLTEPGAGATQVASAKPASGARDKATYYRVQQGDSLYVIAKRFKIDLKRLQAWNPRSSTLRPGQTVTLFLP